METKNWIQAHVTQPVQDIGFGTLLTTAGMTARIITGLSHYAGTNSAAATMSYFILPSQPPESVAGGYNVATQNGVKIFLHTGNLSTVNSAANAFTSVGGTDRGGAAPYLWLPPGYMLIAVVSDANLNGTVIHDIMTAEVC